MKTFLVVLTVFLILLSCVIAIGYAVSLSVQTEEFALSLSSVSPSSGKTIKIVHVSDLHYPDSFLSLQETADLIKEQAPDVIVFTGDIADGNANEEEISALSTFFSSLSSLCPCFLVIGNHEIGSKRLDLFLSTAKSGGIRALLNETVSLTIKGEELAFLGLSDGYPYEEKTFSSLPNLSGKRKILLTHRPEKFDFYVSAPEAIRPDLIFAGHAHGGIARLGNVALYAPNQGLFPRYTSGLYETDGVKMIVSRGMGVSGADFRVFNKYHLPVVTLSL